MRVPPHFRTMTAMSPLQFQKKIRVTEARQLMLTENLDAATAAFQVGYEPLAVQPRVQPSVRRSSTLRDITPLREFSAEATG